ncbi:hypothetical protein SAMN05421786_102207 [Chryseobacterium ureilyticum]|uniref:Uncharacterized protein n=2 Tax=Chryseobacterium ureilyticum TaxID=373668 RepID=A0A1N7M2C5_9FLAO|nr:hypothetical protein SAMN05421786_102207 [Chryseobacterium ureilyticum]
MCLNLRFKAKKINFFKMKKLFFTGLLMVSTLSFAASWTITTTCGVVGTIQIADNASTSQVAQAVSQYNYNQCGVRPAKINLSIEP